MVKIENINNYEEFKGEIQLHTGITTDESAHAPELNMINVTIKTQGTSDYFEIKEFSNDFSEDAELKDVAKWIDLMITDKFTVMGTMITTVKQPSQKGIK